MKLLGLDFQVFAFLSSWCLYLPPPAQTPLVSLYAGSSSLDDVPDQMKPDSLSYLESHSISAVIFQGREEKQGQGTGGHSGCARHALPFASNDLACGFPRFSPLNASPAGRVKISFWVSSVGSQRPLLGLSDWLEVLPPELLA